MAKRVVRPQETKRVWSDREEVHEGARESGAQAWREYGKGVARA